MQADRVVALDKNIGVIIERGGGIQAAPALHGALPVPHMQHGKDPPAEGQRLAGTPTDPAQMGIRHRCCNDL